MAESRWEDQFFTQEHIKITRGGLLFIFDKVGAICANVWVSVRLSDGETKKLNHRTEIETLSDVFLISAGELSIGGMSDRAYIVMSFRPERQTASVDTKDREDLALLSEIKLAFENELAPTHQGAGFVSGKPKKSVGSVLNSWESQDKNVEPTGIRAIRDIPSELPHAKLYIDDIEEIVKVLADVVSDRTPNPAVTLWSDKETYESISAMLSRGGSTRTLNIAVDNSRASVRIDGILRPTVAVYGDDPDAKWATYARIKAIFDARSYKFKNAVAALPVWLKFVLYFAWLFAFGVPFKTKPSGILYLCLMATLSVIVGIELIKPSVVVFRRSHQSRRGSRERLLQYLQNFAFTILGAILSVVAQELYNHFK